MKGDSFYLDNIDLINHEFNKSNNKSFSNHKVSSDSSNISFAGEIKSDSVLKNKFYYKKAGMIYKSTFLPPKHIFPENSKRIKTNDYLIIISPYYNSIEYFDDYIVKIAPSLHLEQLKPIRSKNFSYSAESKYNIEYIGDRFSNIDMRISKLVLTNNGSDSSIIGLEPNFSTTIAPEDFEILEVVGKGHFSKVTKVKYKVDGLIYAMKACKKAKLKEGKQKEHAINERKVLGSINHPFIVNLKFSFQSQTKLYLIMEYLSGGELFFHLKKIKYFTEKVAKFYLAQIICILDFLHENNIIYRDLKPENLVLDERGYIKLTDFGLAKEYISEYQTTSTFCGTPEYLSPEMIKGDPYNQSVDIWSMGIVYFEMLVGVPPFYDENRDKLYKKIYFNDPNFAINKNVVISDLSIDLISKLLCKNPKKRITIRDVKKHELFKDFNFEKLMAYELEAPIKLMHTVSLIS